MQETQGGILEGLRSIPFPGSGISLGDLNLVQSIEDSGKEAAISLSFPSVSPITQEEFKVFLEHALKKIAPDKEVKLDIRAAKPKELNRISHVVAVMSGKGGVGKSSVTSTLAVGLSRSGLRVGILDADITGPSIPKIFGLKNRPMAGEDGFLPLTSAKEHIPIMSANLLLEREDDPIIWRGPLVGKAITQFWEDTLWGNLDILLVDLPPGTSDAPLTVAQSLPLSSVVMVFSPQELASMVVRKAIRMVKEKMGVPILGLIENFSYYLEPGSGKRLEIFGKSNASNLTEFASAPLLARVPIDTELSVVCDQGEIEKYNSDATQEMCRAFLEALKKND